MYRVISFLGLTVLVACTQFPELEGIESADVAATDYPRLVPLEQALAEPSAPSDPDEIVGDLAARRAALEARAKRLSGPVIDAATRRRMERGVRRDI